MSPSARRQELPTAVVYHELTKYSEQELMQNPRQLDWSTKPGVYKDLVSERKVDLSPYLPFSRNPFTGAPLSPSPSHEGDPVGLPQISRLLYFTYGITAVMKSPQESHALRAAPSAGALYPAEIYVATRGIDGIVDGVHDYQVRDHSLVTLWDGDFWSEFQRSAYGHEAIERSRLLVIFSAVFYRSSWRYEERAYRRILLDTGHALGNLECYAPHEHLLVYPVSGFCDAALNSMLFLDPKDEGILMVCALARKADLEGVLVRRSSVYPSGIVSTPVRTPREGLLQRLHEASSIPGTEVFAEGKVPDEEALEALHADKPATELPSIPFELPIPETILVRRSTRAFSGDALTKDQLATILGYSYEVAARDNSPHDEGNPKVFDPSLIETYVIVQAVENVDPGVYYYAPRSRTLRCVRKGQFRDQSHHLCLGQELGLSAAAVVVHVSDLMRALDKYGERAYRYLHLDAGHLGERMNLSALALGAGASGIGGFFDDEVNALLGIDRERIVVYVTCLGRPASA
jgi:SagB-type dehydrogenase family enzyme